jgi:putative peptidoglycan lipid II flippase
VAVSVKRAVAGMSVLNLAGMAGAAAQAIVVARAFGTERAYDLYLLIAVLPELLFIFTQNLFAALLLPFYHRYEAAGGEAAAWRETWRVANVAFVFYAGAAALVFALATPIARLLTHGAAADDVAYAAAVLRVYSPSIGLALILRTFLSLHNARESFVYPAVTNLMPPAFIAAGVLLLGGTLGPMAIAASAVAATCAQIIFLTFRVVGKGFRYWRPSFAPGAPAVRLFLAWAAPLAFGAAAEQLATFIDRQVALTLGIEGAISSLKYGFVLSSFTIAFFSVPLARVTFTYLSRDAARAGREEINARFNAVLRQLAIFYVPATAGLIVHAEPIIRFLFMGGRFDESSLALAKPAVAAYALGLFFLVALNLARYVAYSYKRYLGYSLIAAGAVAATYVLDVAFARLWSYWGIALARGAVSLLWLAAVTAFLARAEGLRLRLDVLGTLARALAAAAPMSYVAWRLSRLDFGLGGPARLEPFAVAVTAAAAGGALYFALLLLLREGEVVNLWRSARAKLERG